MSRKKSRRKKSRRKISRLASPRARKESATLGMRITGAITEIWKKFRKCLIGLGGLTGIILLLAAIVQISGYDLRYLLTSAFSSPTETPTPLAFPPAAEDETLIIVTTFRRDEGDTGDPSNYIFSQLEREIQGKLDIRLKHLRREKGEEIGEAEAREIGEIYGATVVVWGYYTDIAVDLIVENIKKKEWERESLSPEHPFLLSSSQPDEVKFEILTRNVPACANYLALFTIGVVRYNAGEPEKALDFFTEAIEAEAMALKDVPEDGKCDVDVSEAHFYRGNAYADLDDYERAIEGYDQAIALKPDLALAYNNRGVAYGNQGNYERAIEDFDQAIELQPDAAAYSNRGAAYCNLGNYEQAIEDFDQAIALQPDYAGAYSNRGAAYCNLGNYEQAIEDFDQAIALQPDYAGAYNNRGIAYVDLGDPKRAIEDFDQAIALQPGWAWPYNNRGLAYTHLGDYQRAIEDFDQAIALQPDHGIAYIAYTNRGAIYRHLGDHERAIEDHTKAIALQPDDTVAYYDRGVAYYDLGDYERAIEDYTKAIELKPDYAEAYYNRGLTYKSLGEKEKAIADFEKCLELEIDEPWKSQAEQQLKELREEP